jgi:hypothetical protein
LLGVYFNKTQYNGYGTKDSLLVGSAGYTTGGARIIDTNVTVLKVGDVMGVLVDTEQRTVKWYVNGKIYATANYTNQADELSPPTLYGAVAMNQPIALTLCNMYPLQTL